MYTYINMYVQYVPHVYMYTYMYMCTTIITEVSSPYKLLANVIRVKFTDLL